MRTTRFLTAFWSLTRPYWASKQRAKGITLLVTVIALVLAMVWMEVQFNNWNRDFYNTFEQKDQAEFFRQLGLFALLALTWIIMAVYRLYFQQMLQIEWRTWLTDHFLAGWLKDQAHYRMQLLARAADPAVAGMDNPDQRIAEDLRMFVDFTLSLALGLLSAVVTLLSFVIILWALSGQITVFGTSIPGYMVWVALVYAIAGSWLTHVIGRPLIRLDFNQQRFEADFRFGLVRLRENSEGVALYRGEGEELVGLRQRFASVIGNWWGLMLKRKQLGWFTSFYSQLAIIFPYIVVAPRFFSGAIPLGGFMQTASAFNYVQSSLSWFVDVYARLAEWKATVDRLTGFHDAIERARAAAQAKPGIERERAVDASGIVLDGVRLELPDGRVLLDAATERFAPGEAVLLMGPSGAGKSTLFRAIAGIWPFGAGRIAVPEDARMMFLPQRPYLQVGTLRELVHYPESRAFCADAEFIRTLADCGLAHLAPRLDEYQNWALELSVGEQQRIAFCRALLRKPDWLMLDEATSALDAAAEAALYRLLRERLPGTALISIGHRPGLAAYHDRKLDLWAAAAPALRAAAA